nr:hypothetical protein DBT41_12730 [Aerococcus urinae]
MRPFDISPSFGSAAHAADASRRLPPPQCWTAAQAGVIAPDQARPKGNRDEVRYFQWGFLICATPLKRKPRMILSGVPSRGCIMDVLLALALADEPGHSIVVSPAHSMCVTRASVYVCALWPKRFADRSRGKNAAGFAMYGKFLIFQSFPCVGGAIFRTSSVRFVIKRLGLHGTERQQKSHRNPCGDIESTALP